MVKGSRNVYIDLDAWTTLLNRHENCSDICNGALVKAAHSEQKIDQKIDELYALKETIKDRSESTKEQKEARIQEFVSSSTTIYSTEALDYWSKETGLSISELLSLIKRKLDATKREKEANRQRAEEIYGESKESVKDILNAKPVEENAQ